MTNKYSSSRLCLDSVSFPIHVFVKVYMSSISSQPVIIRQEEKSGAFVASTGLGTSSPSLSVGEILVRSQQQSWTEPILLGQKLAAMEWMNFRILQLLAQAIQAMMYVIILADDAFVPRIRRWLAQVVVMGAFLIQFQAWRKRRATCTFLEFLIGRTRVIGFYVFLICFTGYILVSLNYIIHEKIPKLACAVCAWTAFLLALADVFLQINTFKLHLRGTTV
jgi:hypothetical protein